MRTLTSYFHTSLAVLAVTSVVSCGGDSPTSAPSPEKQYRQLQLDHHAVTITSTAPNNTAKLVATALDAQGNPLTDQGSVVFTSSDPSIVSVTADGSLAGLRTGSEVTIVARRKIGNLTLRDTAIVNVNNVAAPVPVLTTFSMQLDPSDSAKVAAGFSATLPQTALDANGNPIDNVAIYYRSSDDAIAFVDRTGTIQGVQPGRVTLYAEATVYGVTKRDSLRYTIGSPIFATQMVLARTPANSMTPVSYFSPSVMTVGVGGFVMWTNDSNQPVDVVFDDPSGAEAVPDYIAFLFEMMYGLNSPLNPNESGNIPAFVAVDSTRGTDGQGVRVRWFPRAGTYKYHSAQYNTTGSIVVTSDSQ